MCMSLFLYTRSEAYGTHRNVRIRFAPPLVITEEELMKAVKIIAEALRDLDKVGYSRDRF